MYDDRALLAVAAKVVGISETDRERENDVLSWLRLFKARELALDADDGAAALFLHLFLYLSPEDALTSRPSTPIVDVMVLDIADVVLVQDDGFQVFLHLLHSGWDVGKVDRLRPASLGCDRQLMRFETMPLTYGYVNRQRCSQATAISRSWI